MSFKKFLLVPIFIFGLLLSASAIAPDMTVYVDAVNGNDTNNGSESAPFKTIQAAVDHVYDAPYFHLLTKSVDIIVRPGEYNEQVLTNAYIDKPEVGNTITHKQLTIKADDENNKPVMNGGYYLTTAFNMNYENNVCIKNFVIKNYLGHGIFGTNCVNTEIRNNVVYNSGMYRFYKNKISEGDGISIEGGYNNTTEGNLTYNNGPVRYAVQWGNGIEYWGNHHSKISKNVSYDNNGNGFLMEYAHYSTCEKNTAINTHFSRNPYPYPGFWIDAPGGNLIKDNGSYNNEIGMILTNWDHMFANSHVVDDNIITGNAEGLTIGSFEMTDSNPDSLKKLYNVTITDTNDYKGLNNSDLSFIYSGTNFITQNTYYANNDFNTAGKGMIYDNNTETIQPFTIGNTGNIDTGFVDIELESSKIKIAHFIGYNSNDDYPDYNRFFRFSWKDLDHVAPNGSQFAFYAAIDGDVFVEKWAVGEMPITVTPTTGDLVTEVTYTFNDDVTLTSWAGTTFTIKKDTVVTFVLPDKITTPTPSPTAPTPTPTATPTPTVPITPIPNPNLVFNDLNGYSTATPAYWQLVTWTTASPAPATLSKIKHPNFNDIYPGSINVTNGDKGNGYTETDSIILFQAKYDEHNKLVPMQLAPNTQYKLSFEASLPIDTPLNIGKYIDVALIADNENNQNLDKTFYRNNLLLTKYLNNYEMVFDTTDDTNFHLAFYMGGKTVTIGENPVFVSNAYEIYLRNVSLTRIDTTINNEEHKLIYVGPHAAAAGESSQVLQGLSPDNPFTSVADALAYVNNYPPAEQPDKWWIKVASGTYDESISIHDNDKSITIFGEKGFMANHYTCFDGDKITDEASYGITISNSSNITISNIMVTNFKKAGIHIINSTDSTIENMVIHNNGYEGPNGYGITINDARGITLDTNLIYDNGPDNCDIASGRIGAGIYAQKTAQSSIMSNAVYGNKGGGILLENCDDTINSIIVKNNSCYYNTASGTPGAPEADSWKLAGIGIKDSQNIHMDYNMMVHNYFGFVMSREANAASTTHVFQNNKVMNNEYGFYITPTSKLLPFFWMSMNGTFTNDIKDNGLNMVSDSTIIQNGNFNLNLQNWGTYVESGEVTAHATIEAKYDGVCINVTTPGTMGWHVQLYQEDLEFKANKTYTVFFTASVLSQPGATMDVLVCDQTDPYTPYSDINTVTLKSDATTYCFEFTMGDTTDTQAKLEFDMGTSVAEILIDDVIIIEQN